MQIVGVRLRKAGRIYFFETDGTEQIVRGDFVVVETSRGLECLEVVVGARDLFAEEKPQTEPGLPLTKIYRKASMADLRQLRENRADETRAYNIAIKKIAEHELPMKLINVEFTFDVSKVTFYFTADGRVDFRDLVRDLAAVFRTRIELRQVGVRDQAKQIGGMGGCGRPLCCASFLGDFIPVSVRMAKDQNLSLNPTKISGVCGRLMCCLKFENDLYCEKCPNQSNQIFQPQVGNRVIVADGTGRVVAVSFSHRNATILLDSRKTVVVSWEDILPVNAEGLEPTSENPLPVEEVQTPEPPPPKPKPQTRPQRPPRRERYERTERPRRTENFNRRQNRPDRAENAERYERSDRRERPERSTRTRDTKPRRRGSRK